MDEQTKAFLREVVNDLEDIRASLGVLLGLAPSVSIAEARERKTQTARVNQDRYEKLRKDLEAL